MSQRVLLADHLLIEAVPGYLRHNGAHFVSHFHDSGNFPPSLTAISRITE